VLQERTHAALKLYRTTSLTAAAIAHACDFADQGHPGRSIAALTVATASHLRRPASMPRPVEHNGSAIRPERRATSRSRRWRKDVHWRLAPSPYPERTMAKSRTAGSSSPAAKNSTLGNPRDSRGHGDELQQMAGGSHPPLTTNQGIPVADNQNSLRASPRGPTLLEDFVLREKITHFDHERIPERIVHARGSAAHGYFELTKSLAKYTTAKILTEVGVKTPLFTRISTVAGGAGSIDTPRDIRGFAVKFYTREGNWDLVGNNIPVFFIQDAMKFPDLVHAVKMEPDRGFPQAASAHDTFWDFISLTPEAMHVIMWAMSDRTIPRSLRMIEGFGIHSFRLIAENGDSTFVKFHWRPKLGLQSHVWDEAVKVAGADPDFHRRDLFEAIQAGNFPEWDLAVQLFTQEQADSFPFDHLDATKIIPEELVPLTVIGRMVLDRWPDNFFAETEQAAYCPANIVPGIDFSNDPLLQGRLFSYLDTQLIRLGGPNFHQLPINAPKCPFANQQRDGHMQMQVPKGRVNYEPSSLDPASARATPAGFPSFAEPAGDGAKGRIRADSFADHYSQARQFYLSQSKPEQAHIASAFVFELSKVQTLHVREAMVGHLRNVDEDLAHRVADGLALPSFPPAQPKAVPAKDQAVSPALQIIGKMKDTLKGRTVGILIHDGSDAATIKALRKAAESAGAAVRIVALKVGGAKLGDGKLQPADGQLAGTPSLVFDAVALVLSADAGKLLAKEAAAVDFVRDAFGHLKAIAADAGAQAVLKAGGVGKDAGVVDAGDTAAFIKAAKTRQWAREPKLRTLA
jgi:catalase